MQKFSLVFLLVLGLLWGGSVRFATAADSCDLARDFAADAAQTFKKSGSGLTSGYLYFR